MLKITYKHFLFVALLAGTFACQSAEKKEAGEETAAPEVAGHNTLSAEEVEEGWELLFNGKDLSGWHKYGGAPVGSSWKVAEGELFLETGTAEGWQVRDGGDIVSEKSFGDFHLSVEWKISQNGNSGIIFYISEDSTKYEWPWNTGPEMQVLDNEGHPDAKIEKHRAGDLYDLISVSEETVKPHGEWNHAEIKSQGGQLEMWLNGTMVISTTLWDDNWKALVAGSKFGSMPDFGTFTEGKIGLQDHGDKVWFRNVKIRPL